MGAVYNPPTEVPAGPKIEHAVGIIVLAALAAVILLRRGFGSALAS